MTLTDFITSGQKRSGSVGIFVSNFEVFYAIISRGNVFLAGLINNVQYTFKWSLRELVFKQRIFVNDTHKEKQCFI